MLDVWLPDINGLDLLERLRAEGDPIPVIIITGSGDVALAVRAMKLCAWTLIEKPCPAAELLAAVREALANEARTRHERALRKAYAARIESLTARQREVMDLLLQGKNTKAIALDLGVTAKAIEGHRARIMAKLEAECMVDVVRVALAAGIRLPFPTPSQV